MKMRMLTAFSSPLFKILESTVTKKVSVWIPQYPPEVTYVANFYMPHICDDLSPVTWF